MLLPHKGLLQRGASLSPAIVASSHQSTAHPVMCSKMR